MLLSYRNVDTLPFLIILFFGNSQYAEYLRYAYNSVVYEYKAPFLEPPDPTTYFLR